jgi:NitT/TauT family transport system substrate-binding protein
MSMSQTRRRFVASASAAGVAGLLGSAPARADEGPLETTTVRLLRNTSICQAPGFIAEELLLAEGFTEVRFVDSASPDDAAARGEIDFDLDAAPLAVSLLDAGQSIIAVGGVHAGCYELFAHGPIQTIRDLKGRTVVVRALSSPGYLQTAAMAAAVGLDPRKDIGWVESPDAPPIDLFVRRKVDALIGFPPVPQELRARKIGHVIASTTTDKPWSQYHCCIVVGNRDFVRAHPVATKRFLRAILKATELCAAAPEVVARRLVEKGFTPRYDYALQTLTELPYKSWREFDVEDSLRFYALRLHEVGMIKSTPKQIIAEGVDWHFFDELKRELKA